MTKDQSDFLLTTTKEAHYAGHPWPEYAACEAALESNYGESELAKKANNLFGMKAHSNTSLEHILGMPTHEYSHGAYILTMAHWMKYDTIADCFEDRLETLQRLEHAYPSYQDALASTTGEAFVFNVSRTWSTDPNRAAKVIAIFNAMSNEMGVGKEWE